MKISLSFWWQVSLLQAHWEEQILHTENIVQVHRFYLSDDVHLSPLEDRGGWKAQKNQWESRM